MYYRVFATFFIVLFFSSNISAIATGGDPPGSISVTTPNQNGNYTVSWTKPLEPGTYSLSSNSISAFAPTPIPKPTPIPTLYQYRLYVSKNGGSWANVLYNVPTLSHAVVGQSNGSYRYSVKACTFYQCSVSTYSRTIVIADTPVTDGREVQYIHTDLLGSPVAESDQDGEIK